MSQNDYVIANQTTPLFRADLNLALQALASNSSGSSAPSTTYANMLWYDTTNNILKMRSEADDAWISIGTLDQSLNTFSLPESPEFTGTPTAPTAPSGTNTTQIATTAFVQQEIAAAPSGWETYDGSATGKIYDFSIDGAVSSIETPVFEDLYEYRFFMSEMVSSTSLSVRAEFYRATDLAWSATDTTAVGATTTTGYSYFDYILNTPYWTRFDAYVTTSYGFNSSSGGQFSDMVSLTNAQKISKVRFSTTAGTIVGGKLYMYKRLGGTQ